MLNKQPIEQGLNCVIDENIQVIILGTFPSIKSRHECYYNHPKNLFWPIVSIIFNKGNSLITKEERYGCLLKHHIGLWDVIKQCEFETKSSLDSKIIKESIRYNDFKLLRKFCPKLHFFIFSSKNAERIFKGYMKQLTLSNSLKKWLQKDIKYITLTSTSPANARVSVTEKIEIWQKTLNNIQKSINPQRSKPHIKE